MIRFSTSLILLVSFLSTLLNPAFADKKPKELLADSVTLTDTRVDMTWQEFQKLARQKRDTVHIKPDSKAPVPLVFDNADIQVSLADSNVNCRLTVDYTVLSKEPWSSVLFLESRNEYRFTDIGCSKGDFLSATDSGYVLLVQKAGKNPTRSVRCTWSMAARMETGLRRVRFAVPQASRGTIQVKAPVGFTDIGIDNAVLLSQKRGKNSITYTYSLPEKQNIVQVRYAPPIRIASSDSTADKTIDEEKATKEPKLSSTQETVLFVSEGNVFSLTTVLLNVVHAPISRFRVQIPGDFSLLRVEGNGIQQWKLIDSTLLSVNLTFELEGIYTLLLVGEKEADSVITVPSFKVPEAIRHTGRFSIAVDGSGEAHFLSMKQCIATPRRVFTDKMSNGMSKALGKYKRDIRDILLAGSYYKQPFAASFSVKRHTLVPVANALADSGVVITAITEDGKVITQATYWIRQRNKQFLSLTLPDTCDLWSVDLNGKDLAPFLDDSGVFKVSLQRYVSSEAVRKPVVLKFTYFTNMKSAENTRRFTLPAPVPDVPVNALSWSIFYPEEWHPRKATGDFTTTRSTLLGKKRLYLGREISERQYQRLLRSNKAQQKSGKAMDLPVMAESPKHLYARRILIVDEHPELTISFISKSMHYAVRGFVILVVLAGILWGGFYFYMRLKRK